MLIKQILHILTQKVQIKKSGFFGLSMANDFKNLITRLQFSLLRECNVICEHPLKPQQKLNVTKIFKQLISEFIALFVKPSEDTNSFQFFQKRRECQDNVLNAPLFCVRRWECTNCCLNKVLNFPIQQTNRRKNYLH